jgi:hypothetical protein
MRVVNEVSSQLKLHLERLFQEHYQADLSIPSIIEGQSGGSIKIIVDDVYNPTVAQFFQGSFTVFAGGADSDLAKQLIINLPQKCYIMPSADKWISLEKYIHGDKLLEKERHSFSPETLKIDDLNNIINQHPHQQRLEQIHLETQDECLQMN